MAPDYKTPGVYIEEKNAFPNSVVAVATAIPAFIGYVPSLGNAKPFKPVRVSSMADFSRLFAFPEDPSTKQSPPAYSPRYHLSKLAQAPKKGRTYIFNGAIYAIEPDPATVYQLYASVLLFFQNGGRDAYIVPVGTYGRASGQPIQPGDPLVNPNVKLADLQKGLAALKEVDEVTMYVFPEGTLLKRDEYNTLMQCTLLQCGELRTAVAIFDLIGGRAPDPNTWTKDVQAFRDGTGDNFLKYGAAYYPFVKTTAIDADEVTYLNLGGDLTTLLQLLDTPNAPNPPAATLVKAIQKGNVANPAQQHAALLAASKTYGEVMRIILEKINTLPPSAAMAGLYAMVDEAEGVWKAPANISPIGVTELTLNINDAQQSNLNVDAVSGKSINALRYFVGRGILVWGARTLDGNSQDWRYINVQRTAIMLEQSAKLALRAYVFEPNDANTWLRVKVSLESFLFSLWKQGALAGSQPSDAYFVQIGLGTTMTASDITDGIMHVNIGFAIARPAEFIIIALSQKMNDA